MLNHIWLALVIIGIFTAAGRDIYDASRNSYGNGVPWRIRPSVRLTGAGGERKDVSFTIGTNTLHRFSGLRNAQAEKQYSASAVFSGTNRGRMSVELGKDAPAMMQTIAEAQGNPGALTGEFRFNPASGIATFHTEPVHFVYVKRITNAAFEAAKLAVTIAIGLIGIMALWLGIMKVAEASGLVLLLAKAVRPVTKRLFPDVPHDHPAIASMMMNIAANMLGLGNAATPFGLKAMEELNSINPKAGVASNSMVTFLALNTSCITLIPATAIAIRAASGSNDPALIIGATFLASLTATIAAVIIAKLLQRLRMFRIPGEEAA